MVSLVVENVVCPDAFNVLVPILFVPSLNVTVPCGVPPADEVTVAVNVTDCPCVDGFGLEESATVEGSFTPCVIKALLVLQ